MRLDHATWLEVEEYLEQNQGVLLPVGSTEQHGPMGMVGTDALCAEAIAGAAADKAGAYVAPTICYTPAHFNTGFPGTVSISEPTFKVLFAELVTGLRNQGFNRVFVLNAHGANLAPMRAVVDEGNSGSVRIRSWWDYASVNDIRREYYGDWEGMHATPSEISVTQALHRIIPIGNASDPPRQLTAEEIEERAGDRHGSPERHREEFPDGRVGSHSALARPEHGVRLIAAAVEAVATDFVEFAES
ncbi:MAG: creatininase family protein [Boseongicola sp.]